MPENGKGSQEYDLYIQQQHGKLEDSVMSGVVELGKVDIRREIFQETPCNPYCL